MTSSEPPAPTPRWRFRVVASLMILVVRALRLRIRTLGLDHVPRVGGAVVTWNHTSHLDVVMTMWDVYRCLGRSCRFLAMRELWSSRTLGWVPRLADAVPVDRATDEGRDRALRDAVTALRDGHLVLVAPEGGISVSFEARTWRTGAVRMAQLAGVPLIPSVSWGSHRVSTTGHRPTLRSARRLPVTVRFGAPVHLDPGEDPVAATHRVERIVAAMVADLQRTYPDGAPAGQWWVPARLGGGAPRPEEVGEAALYDPGDPPAGPDGRRP